MARLMKNKDLFNENRFLKKFDSRQLIIGKTIDKLFTTVYISNINMHKDVTFYFKFKTSVTDSTTRATAYITFNQSNPYPVVYFILGYNDEVEEYRGSDESVDMSFFTQENGCTYLNLSGDILYDLIINNLRAIGTDEDIVQRIEDYLKTNGVIVDFGVYYQQLKYNDSFEIDKL